VKEKNEKEKGRGGRRKARKESQKRDAKGRDAEEKNMKGRGIWSVEKEKRTKEQRWRKIWQNLQYLVS
jgi:hypothetical protein